MSDKSQYNITFFGLFLRIEMRTKCTSMKIVNIILWEITPYLKQQKITH